MGKLLERCRSALYISENSFHHGQQFRRRSRASILNRLKVVLL